MSNQEEIKKCTECLADIPKKAKKCAQCGSKQKGRYGGKHLVVGLVLLFGFIWLIASLGGDSSTPTPSTISQQARTGQATQIQEEALELVSWQCYNESGFFHITGEVKNISGKSLENVTAVGNAYTGEEEFVKSEDALIDYNPILPGQTSPFEVLMSGNPAISKCKVLFKELFGGTIPTKRSE